MKVEIELDPTVVDNLVRQTLLQVFEDCQEYLKKAKSEKDKIEAVLYLEAARRMHNYFSVPDDHI